MRSAAVHDLAVIIPSLDDGSWLARCLPTLRSACDGLDVDVVVADIESSDDTVEQAERHGARVVPTFNGGFAHANNAAHVTCDARYVLFLNADTEVVEGTLTDLVERMDARPEIGIAGCRQLTPDGDVYPTMRRFMRARRVMAEALFAERLAPRAGHRVLDERLYERDVACEWTIGSFMLCRNEALWSAGCMDERFFFMSEEEDLCLRVREAGWEIRHLPYLTIVHHVGKRGVSARFEAQRAFARHQYAAKHFTAPRRIAALGAQVAYDGIRALPLPGTQDDRRAAARAALRVTLGRDGPPFREPPPTALPAGATQPGAPR